MANLDGIPRGTRSDMLSESTYDMMSDSMLASDDDDASSVASFEGADITSIGDIDSLHELQDDHSDAGDGIPTFEGLDDNLHNNLHGSVRTVMEEVEPLPPTEIEFDESEGIIDGQVAVVHTLSELDDEETARISSQFQNTEALLGKLVLNVHQTMTKELLSVHETFRILYLGEEGAKETIMSKIGAALVVSSGTDLSSKEASPSRYNIVPVSSFGHSDPAPEVELVEHFGIGMEVHTCSHAGSAKNEEGGDTISLVLHPRAVVRSSWTHNGGRHLEAGNWKLPHLVVYYCTEHDDSETRQTRDYTKAFMARHSVPGIVISDKTFYYEKPHFVHDTRSVHMTLESPSSNKVEGVVYKRIPVSLPTFLSLDNRQMNRNIACITGLFKQNSQSLGMEKKLSSNPSTTKEASLNSKRNYDGGIFGSHLKINDFMPKEMWTMVLIGWFLFCGILTGCVIKMKLSAQQNSAMGIQVHPATTGSLQLADTAISQISSQITFSSTTQSQSASILSSSSSSASTYSQAISSASVSSQTSSHAEVTKSLSKVYERVNSALSLIDLPSPVPQNSEQNEKFTLHSIGDGHIVIRPPSSFLRQKKPPRLHVSVLKFGKQLDIHLSEIFKGVYDLSIHRDDAWGVLKIEINTKSKPVLRESFLIDLGSQWLKVNSWKKAAWTTSSRVQKYLGTASEEARRRAKQFEVPKVAGDVNKKVIEKAEVLRGKLSEAKEKVAEAGDSLYKDHLSKPFSKFWDDVKNSHLQKRVTERVSRAQKRANRLWKKGHSMKVKEETFKVHKGRKCRGGCGKKAKKFKGIR